MKKILLIILFPFSLSSQNIIGQPINGEANGDNSGNSISLSSNGNIIAIGEYGNDGNGTDSGQVRIFQNNSGTWTQIGNDINGEAAGDFFGINVSLSSDGNIVAIGGLYNDGNGIDSGHVRVYRNIAGNWTQIGSDINGEAADDKFGTHVCISSNGAIVAIAAPNNDGNGSNSGHVRIYQNTGGSWVQLGNDIDGSTVNDQLGRLALSGDGTIIAVGSMFNNLNTGYAKVYQYASGSWTQVGNTLIGENMGDTYGSNLSLSADGNILAVSAPSKTGNAPYSGQVRIYQNVGGTWTQIGNDINGEAELDLSGFGLEISDQGNIVAIGAMQNDSNGTDSGYVRIFKNISGTWIQIGTNITGQATGDLFGRSISLSSDVNTLAIGSIYNDTSGTDSGQVRIYSLSAILASDSFVQSNFSVYPNPSNGIINITLKNNLQLEKVSLYNQLGQLVKTAATNMINTTELAQGTYYVEVFTNQGKATKKIIVE